MKTIFDAAYVLAIRTLFGGHAPSILISLWDGISNDTFVNTTFQTVYFVVASIVKFGLVGQRLCLKEKSKL